MYDTSRENHKGYRVVNGESRMSDGPEKDPIVVVGFAFKFPGDATDPASFWNMMIEQRCAVTRTPADRISEKSWHHPDQSRRGQFYTRGAHYLQEDISLFDAPFFSLSAEEAAGMDPQQRHLLEVTYHALENSGIPLNVAVGSHTSVHVGCFTNDYGLQIFKDIETSNDYDVFGVNTSMNANRISWFYDFKGASMNVDTACSSSLVALDLACQELQSAGSNMGIVAGTNLIFSPDFMQILSNVNMLSPDGKSYSFDHRANGYGRGEGTGAIVVKRLSDALRDGDTIRAVIRSTGQNQDGRTPLGIMQPSSDAQSQLILNTYAKSGLSLEPTRYFEAHGTGTPVGDPIEVNALGEVFRRVRTDEDPLFVGSVKSNIGHLEGASGIASVIKTILIIEKGIIPPCANLEKINPKIDTEWLRIKFALTPTPWPTSGLRRASINSFGFGGSNAHIVLDDAFNFLKQHGLSGNHATVELPPPTSTLPVNGMEAHDIQYELPMPKLFVVSAHDKAGVKRVASAYSSFLEKSSKKALLGTFAADLAHTLNTRRSALPYRSFWTASNRDQLIQVEERVVPAQQVVDKPVLGFVFTGQGAQWAGMGRELLKYSAFRISLTRSENYLKKIGSTWSLEEEICCAKDMSRINTPEVAQPATTALQIALVDLLRSVGVQPAAVIGHSSGEIAASYTQGTLSAAEAIRIAFFRGICAARLSQTQDRAGGMISVGISKDDAATYIEEIARAHGRRGLDIACINSQKNVTVSGDETQVDALREILDGKKIFARKLAVPVAYHSFHMEDISALYRELIGPLDSSPPVPTSHTIMVSSVTGQQVQARDMRSVEYWVKNLTSPVRFSTAFNKICTKTGKVRKKLDCSHLSQIGVNFILEVGPHSGLQAPIRNLLELLPWSGGITYSSLLQRGKNAAETFLTSIGNLYCCGVPVDLSAVNRLGESLPRRKKVIHDLPEYPFNHKTSYWHESRIASQLRLDNRGKLDLLGKPALDWNPLEPRWRNIIRASELPWVQDHVVNGVIMYPAAGMVVMAIEAANQMADPNRKISGFQLKDISFLRALVIPTGESGVETHLYLSEETSSWTKFRLSSFDNGRWHENCHGLIKVEYETGTQNKLDRFSKRHNEITKSCILDVDHDRLYKTASDSGLVFGPTFQTTHGGRISKNREAISLVNLYTWPTNEYPQSHVVHPTTLDGIFHLTLAILSDGGRKDIPTAVPSGIRRIWIAKNGLSTPCGDPDVKVFACVTNMHKRGHECDIQALNTAGTVFLAQIDGLQSTIVRTKSADQAHRHTLYHLDTVPDIDFLDKTQLSSYCAQAERGPDPLDYHLDLNFVLYAFLDKTMQSLGDIDHTKLKPHVLRYIEWVQHQLNQYQKGQLPLGRDEWKDLIKDEAYFDAACERVSAANSQGFMFVHLGKNLPSILRGEQDPLQFLFKDDYIHAYYRETNDRPCFGQWDRYLQIYAAKNPKMRILEIGAGTGATTTQVLHALSHGCGHSETNPVYMSYDFTDLSPVFPQRAQEKYKNYPRIKYQVLNIEKDPVQQGYAAESYDLIIAANVLHATPKLSYTLANVRKLLKPKGKLMLYEITRPEIVRSGFVGGLMAGWWAGMEDGRPWSPAITTAQWADLLTDAGFSGIDLEIPEYNHPDCQETSIMVSTAVSNVAPERSLVANDEQFTNVTFIVDPQSVFQKGLFEQAQGSITSQYPGSVVEEVPWEECASLPSLKQTTLVFLLETETAFFSQISEENLTRLQRVINQCGHVLWVTAGGGATPKNLEHYMATGWVRTVSNERTMGRICNLALDINGPVRSEQVEYVVRVLAEEVFKDKEHQESEFIEVDGSLHIPLLRPNLPLSEDISAAEAEEQVTVKPIGETGAVKLQTRELGTFGGFQWIEDSGISEPLQADEVEINVRAVGVNVHDCLVALGKNPGVFGLECAGVVTRVGSASIFKPGEQVVSFGQGLFQTTIRNKDNKVCKAPVSLSFSEAASIPFHFGTAWQAINEISRVQKGDRVLIHAGPGGVWPVSVQIAQFLGAEIFVMVDSNEQKSFIKSQYQITEDRILSRENASFMDLIMNITEGDGVDVLLINSNVNEDVFVASCECLAPDARIVEIGEKASSKLLSVALAETTNISYTHFNSTDWMKRRPQRAKKIMDTVVGLVEQKALRLQPIHAFAVNYIKEAFQMANADKTTDKVVVDFTSVVQVPVLLKKTFRCTFNPDVTYVITGGFGGLGRVIARWMVGLGARNLVLLGRSGAKTDRSKELVRELESQNVRVATPPCDMIDPEAVRQVFQELSHTMPPIKGCIHGSLVLRDRLFHDLTYDDWRVTAECRAAGSWNLETNLPRDLDFFILLSSASGVVGLPSQSNYASGNTYMDALAKYRVAKGQKAVSIDLGAMCEDGILVETGILDKVLSYGPMAPVSRKALLGLLDHYCNKDLPILTPETSQILIGLTLSGEGYMGKLFARKRLFCHPEVTIPDEQDNGTPRIDARRALTTATSLQDARDIVTQSLVSKLTYDYKVITEDLDIDLQAPLYTLGVDSLLAVELCKWVANEFSADLATFEVLGGASMTTMSTMVTTRSQLQHPAW
ncbi:Lovastatin nonaketide synthase [Talaromyces islandicus]|uniref:Lovastatin nonaketide synthase n=1 Tax=Talaromyces islandicus TaxID=28573 RepID=A0A0U1LNP3_TALIS|nr:Lovastatin nonaketide synthase [Talaromyces islandicus]